MTQEEKIRCMEVVREEACMWYSWLDRHVTEDSQRAIVAPKMNARIAEIDRMIDEEKREQNGL